MAQTLKKKNITRYIKIQVAHDKKNPRSSKTDQHFQKKQKFNKKNSFFSHKIKNHKLFSKLIGLLNNKCKFESRLKPNPIKFPVKIFLKNMPLRLMNQIHENREGSQNFSAKPVKSLSKKINRYQKKLKLLRQENKSKLSSFFYTPWKNIKLAPTKKQQWLNSAYTQYKYLRFKDRIDFFRGYLGRIMLLTELHSTDNYKASWFSRYYFLWKNTELKINNPKVLQELHEFYQKTALSNQNLQSKILQLQKQAWWYENLVQKKKSPKSTKKFILDRPNTAFRIHWKQQKREPWKNALLFKRAVYSGFGEDLRKENKFNSLNIKPYLRRKNPRYEKRNQIYHKLTLLLANRRKKFRIRADKIARIKQIASKVLFPFYGNLRFHQRRKIVKKSRLIKSTRLSFNEFLLAHFERRLDVVIYRLNLAPTILWARRLILDGSIFVIPQNLYTNNMQWTSMYGSLKKFAFPLKLRDPKNLYAFTLLKNLPQHWGAFKFFGCPQTNISYLVQPGDLIQCSFENSLNKFKTLSSLWQKPLASHLLTSTKKTFVWDWRAQKYVKKSFVTWKGTSEKVNSAIFLHTPVFGNLSSADRVKESFLRWAAL